MNSSSTEIKSVKAQSVDITDDTLSVDLDDARTISVPIGWFPRLVHGTPEERTNWRLIAGGEGIHWNDLDEDISVQNLLAGQPSGESQRSLQQWLDQRVASDKASQ